MIFGKSSFRPSGANSSKFAAFLASLAVLYGGRSLRNLKYFLLINIITINYIETIEIIGVMHEQKRKVLIVEDENETLQWLKALFAHGGYECFSAEDGAMAVSSIMRIRPDLLVLDLGLPAGSGMFVLETVRSHPVEEIARMPVIVFSGDKWFDQNEALAAGATAFFTKPAGNEELLEAAQKAITVQKTLPASAATPELAPQPVGPFPGTEASRAPAARQVNLFQTPQQGQ